MAFVAPSAGAADTRTGRLLVTLAPGPAGKSDVRALASRHRARVALPPIEEIRLAVLAPADARGPDALASELRADPAVSAVRAERRIVPRLLPNDAAFSAQLAGAPLGISEEW